MVDMLKIWGRKTSVNVQKVMWAVAELGLPHERIDAGGPFGKTDTPEYGALNPNRLVPVIDDGGFTLWESNACVRYLAQTYGAGTLAPADAKTRARADQWMDWSITVPYPDIIGGLFVQFVRVTAAERKADAVAASAQRAGEKLALLDAQLAGHTFILGDTLTMADIAVGTLLYRYFTMPITRPALPNVEAYFQRLSGRKAYQDHAMIDWMSMKIPGA
jgi:glutathione S-transferase